jgi:hypothetical protein
VGRYTVRRWEGGKREPKGRRCGEREEEWEERKGKDERGYGKKGKMRER